MARQARRPRGHYSWGWQRGPYTSEPALRKCGFGLACIRPVDDYHFKYLGHDYGSVSGRQTVPRAEATAILHALRFTRGNATFVCDNYDVASCFNKGPKHSPSTNGLLWHEINQAREFRASSGYGVIEVVWMKAHLSYETAINMDYPHFWWIGNSYADKLANKAAKLHQPSNTRVEKFRADIDLTRTALKHHIAIACHLAPKGAKPSLVKQAAQLQVSKIDKVRQLAKEAGHHLGPDERCVGCGLLVPFHKNLAFIECVLNLRCMGSVGAHFPSYKLFSSDGSDSHYLYGGTKVHATHVIATHFLLKKHFCTFCGAYGSQRSKNLQRPCPKVPTKAGLGALKRISKGIRPDCYKEAHVARFGRQSRHRVKLPRNSLTKLRDHHCSQQMGRQLRNQFNKCNSRGKPAGRMVPIEPPSFV